MIAVKQRSDTMTTKSFLHVGDRIRFMIGDTAQAQGGVIKQMIAVGKQAGGQAPAPQQPSNLVEDEIAEVDTELGYIKLRARGTWINLAHISEIRLL